MLISRNGQAIAHPSHKFHHRGSLKVSNLSLPRIKFPALPEIPTRITRRVCLRLSDKFWFSVTRRHPSSTPTVLPIFLEKVSGKYTRSRCYHFLPCIKLGGLFGSQRDLTTNPAAQHNHFPDEKYSCRKSALKAAKSPASMAVRASATMFR